MPVSIKIRCLVFTTNVLSQTCGSCRKIAIDPNELSAYKVGIAMRIVGCPVLTGRGYAACRKALHLNPEEAARRLNISIECLIALEDTNTPVPHPMCEFITRRVQHRFKTLAFVPRVPLEPDPPPSAPYGG